MEPIKRQRKESDSVYTIMLIPHKGHEPREHPFSPQPVEKRLVLFAVCSVYLVQVFFFSLRIFCTRHIRINRNC